MIVWKNSIPILFRIIPAAGIIALAVFLVPQAAFAYSALHWTSLADGETIVVENGGAYEVPLNTPGEIFIETDAPVFDTEGVLFFIPDPESPTREFLSNLGGFFGPFEVAWPQEGVYELDVYAGEPPVPTLNPFQKLFAWFFGTPAYAQNPELFIETIRFTIIEAGVDPPEYEECCSSVVFLPGIQGSVLVDGANMLWPPTLGNVGEDLGKLMLYEDGTPVTPGVAVEGIVNTATIGPVSVSIYQGFTDFMDSLVTAEVINEWEPLPYDWRYSPERVIEDADMVEVIENLAANSDTGQVTLVAHSMGGLVGKALIKALMNKGEGDLIDSFVMVTSPQLGTPQAVAGLLHGEGSSIPIIGPFEFVTKAEARALGHDLPSAYNLLPSEQYFADVIDPPVTFDTLTPLTLSWRNFWGLALNDYSSLFEFLSGNVLGIPIRLPPAYGDTQSPAVLREDLLAEAALFHQEFDDFMFPIGMRVVQVAGWGLETIKGIEYTEDDGELDYRPLFTTEGDQTVVYPSAVSTNDEIYYFNLFNFNRDNSIDVQHGNILGAFPVTSLIQAVVEESDITLTPYIVTDKPSPTNLEDRLLVSVHSPMTIGVTEGDNFTGVLPGQSQDADILFTVSDIPGSLYFTFGSGKYVSLPAGGSYTVALAGTGGGSATVLVEGLAGGTQNVLAEYVDIPVTSATEAVLALGGSPGTLIVDQNGDGQTDIYVAPEGASLSVVELFVNLKTAIQNLDTADKLKVKLLKKVEKIEKKIAKQKLAKASKVAMNLEKQVMKKVEKGRIGEPGVQALLELLDMLAAAL